MTWRLGDVVAWWRGGLGMRWHGGLLWRGHHALVLNLHSVLVKILKWFSGLRIFIDYRMSINCFMFID